MRARTEEYSIQVQENYSLMVNNNLISEYERDLWVSLRHSEMAFSSSGAAVSGRRRSAVNVDGLHRLPPRPGEHEQADNRFSHLGDLPAHSCHRPGPPV